MENYLFERFGITLEPKYKIKDITSDRFALYSNSLDNFKAEREETRGMIAGKKNGAFKPTSDLLQYQGWQSTRNVVFVDKHGANAFCAGKDIIEGNFSFCTRGYVSISHNGIVLGCGFFDGEKVQNMVPLHKQVIGH